MSTVVPHCEYSYYRDSPVDGIGEFCSGITALGMCIAALIPLETHVSAFPIHIARASLFWAGVGGTIYHFTVNEAWRLAEDIPLLFAETFLTLSYVTSMVRDVEWHALLCFLASLYIFAGLLLETLEPLHWGLQVLSLVPMTSLAVLTWKHGDAQNTIFYVRRGNVAGVTAWVVWCVDTWACNEWTAMLRLHALWHCLTAYQLWCMINIACDVESYWTARLWVPMLRDSREVELNQQVRASVWHHSSSMPYQLMGLNDPFFRPMII